MDISGELRHHSRLLFALCSLLFSLCFLLFAFCSLLLALRSLRYPILCALQSKKPHHEDTFYFTVAVLPSISQRADEATPGDGTARLECGAAAPVPTPLLPLHRDDNRLCSPDGNRTLRMGRSLVSSATCLRTCYTLSGTDIVGFRTRGGLVYAGFLRMTLLHQVSQRFPKRNRTQQNIGLHTTCIRNAVVCI